MEAFEFDFFDNNTIKKELSVSATEESLRKDTTIVSKKLDDYLNIYFDFSVLHKTISDENRINNERESFLRKKVTNQLIETIFDESFEFGLKSKSESIIEKQLNINALATRNWLNDIFIDFFDDEKIIIGILRIIGRFEENLIFPQGQTMALAALNHKNPEIKELGIRAFENWGTFNSIKVLENIELDIDWLCEYKKQVVEDIKEELYVSHS
ncbi:hypothetical protein H8E88_30650 [candidate division KSB1 bacterium]|nr:hypothetical protein [candidate division KSB1 bacterium]MBL7095563.1 hypothetical protein [candidate division KSB1 bacterium]